MGRWDSFSKRLIGSRPWQYASWLISGAVFIEALNVELKAQEFLADALLKVLLAGQLVLLHIEFQSYEDPTMGRRMLEFGESAVQEEVLYVSGYYERLVGVSGNCAGVGS